MISSSRTSCRGLWREERDQDEEIRSLLRLYSALRIRSFPAEMTSDAPRTGVKQDITAQQADFFEAKIRPVLVEHCFKCHGPRKQESGLRLDSRESMLRGTDDGPVVVPGHPEEEPVDRSDRV